MEHRESAILWTMIEERAALGRCWMALPPSLNLAVIWDFFGACHLTLKGLVDTRTPVEVAFKEL